MSELPERDRFLEMLSIPGQYAQEGLDWLIKGFDYVTDQTNTWEAMGYTPEQIEQNKEALKYEIATGIIGGGAALKGFKALSPHVKKLMKSIQNALKSKTGSKITHNSQGIKEATEHYQHLRGHRGMKSNIGNQIKELRNLNRSNFTPENIKVLRNLNRRNKESIDRLKKTRGTGWDSMSPSERVWMEREAAKFKELISELPVMEKATGIPSRTGGSSMLKKLLPFLLLSEHK